MISVYEVYRGMEKNMGTKGSGVYRGRDVGCRARALQGFAGLKGFAVHGSVGLLT